LEAPEEYTNELAFISNVAFDISFRTFFSGATVIEPPNRFL
jgi:hypothetical protein